MPLMIPDIDELLFGDTGLPSGISGAENATIPAPVAEMAAAGDVPLEEMGLGEAGPSAPMKPPKADKSLLSKVGSGLGGALKAIGEGFVERERAKAWGPGWKERQAGNEIAQKKLAQDFDLKQLLEQGRQSRHATTEGRKTNEFGANITRKDRSLDQRDRGLGLTERGQDIRVSEGEKNRAASLARARFGIDNRRPRIQKFESTDPNTGETVITLRDIDSGEEHGSFRGKTGAAMAAKAAEAKDSLNKLRSALSLYNPEWVGPVAGRAEKLWEKLPLVEQDGERATFGAGMAAMENYVIKSITGAQMSEAEVPRLRNQIPRIEDPSEVFEGKARILARAMQITEMVMSGQLGRDEAVDLINQMTGYKKTGAGSALVGEIDVAAPQRRAMRPTPAPASSSLPEGVRQTPGGGYEKFDPVTGRWRPARLTKGR